MFDITYMYRNRNSTNILCNVLYCIYGMSTGVRYAYVLLLYFHNIDDMYLLLHVGIIQAGIVYSAQIRDIINNHNNNIITIASFTIHSMVQYNTTQTWLLIHAYIQTIKSSL